MIRKIFFLLLTVIVYVNGISQTVYFKPKWKAGTTLNYNFFKNRYNPKDSNYVQDTDTTLAKMKVVAANATGFEIQVVLDYTKRKKPTYPPAGLKKIVEEVKKKPIVLQLDTSGKYTGIKNWQEVKNNCLKLIEDEKKKAPEEEKGTWDYVITKVGSKEQIEKLFAGELEFFFMLYGSELRNNATHEYEDEMPNPYSPTPIFANTFVEVGEDAENKTWVEVNMFTTPDPVRAATQLQQITTLILGAEENDAEIAAPVFDVQDYYVYLNDTKSGTHRTAIYLRYLKSANKEEIESWKFILAD